MLSVAVPAVLLRDRGGGQDGSSLPHTDGILFEVRSDRLLLTPYRPLDGQNLIEFEVRPEHADALDIPHLQSHASSRLPSPVFYERDGERYVARFVEDLPPGSR